MVEGRWDEGLGAPATSAEQAFTRRVKSLARTAPIHDLEATKAQRAGDWSGYDLRALALAALDCAIEHMGLEYGATTDVVVGDVAARAAHLAPGRPPAEYRRVAAAVLEGLLNERDRRQAFAIPYADPDGERRVLAFHLLREFEAPDGAIVVRATTEAINLFVGALDLDVEDAQAAAEAVLKAQLARGRLDQAVTTAREARIRSIQFAEKVRSLLDATRRDIRQVDWGDEVPRLLDDALRHLKERIDTERQLLRTTRSTLDAADPTKVGQAAELVELLEDCRHRHLQLHEKLLGARQVFLDEQQRQLFAPNRVLPLPDLEADLLLPLLEGGRDAALVPLTGFFGAAAGPRPPAVVRLGSLVAALLQPRRERGADGPELVEPELEARAVDLVRFGSEAWAAAAAVFEEGAAEARRLSSLLAAARDRGPGVANLVALLAVRWFAPDQLDAEPGSDQLGGLRFESVDDRAVLADAGFGGTDLLVVPAATNDDGWPDADETDVSDDGESGDAPEPVLEVAHG